MSLTSRREDDQTLATVQGSLRTVDSPCTPPETHLSSRASHCSTGKPGLVARVFPIPPSRSFTPDRPQRMTINRRCQLLLRTHKVVAPSTNNSLPPLLALTPRMPGCTSTSGNSPGHHHCRCHSDQSTVAVSLANNDRRYTF